MNIQLFANGVVSLGTSGKLQGRIVWSSTSNGSSANTSRVEGTLQVRKTDYYAPTAGTFTGWLNIGGESRNFSYYGSITGDWVTVMSFNKTISHNPDGTGKCYLAGRVTGPTGTSMAGNYVESSSTVNLDKIARYATVTNANNFTDEENPYMTFNNPGGFSIDCYLEFAKQKIIRTNVPNTGSYTFILTQEEKDLLYSECVNSNKLTVRYVIQTTIDGEKFWTWLDKTMTVINANPQFNDFDWETTNYNNLTGDNKTIIKNYSNVKTIVSEENKATALKKAIITSYQTTIGSKPLTNNNLTYPVETVIEKVDGASITVFANDSRGNSTPIIKPITNYIEYEKISGSITVLKRTQEVNSEVVLEIEGEIDKVNFGAIQNNIVSCKYYYKDASSNDDFIEGTTQIAATYTQIEGSKYKYKISQNIAGDLGANGFNIDKSFLIKVVINDELDLAEDTETLGNGSPAIAVFGNCVSLGAPYDEELGGRVQIGGKKVNIPEVLNKYLAGIYTVLSLPVSGSTTGDVNIGTCYKCKDHLLDLCPLKSGYKRTYKSVTYANTGRNRVILYLGGNEIGNFSVWGSAKGTTTEAQIKDITEIINSLPTGHAEIKMNNNYDGTGSNFYYINRIEIWAYDTLEDEVAEETTTN